MRDERGLYERLDARGVPVRARVDHDPAQARQLPRGVRRLRSRGRWPRFGERDVERLLGDAGIVRNRAKIEAAIANARATLALREAGTSLPELVWSHAPAEPAPAADSLSDLPPTTPESVALAKALKKAGFRFLGPTTVYAAMQECGVVNDHLAGCPIRALVAAAS